MFGRKSEISIPDWPRGLKARCGASNLFFATARLVLNVPNDSGIGWPASRIRSGFGSNRSTWLGPPDMKRKMTLLALAWKWVGDGDSGLIDGGASAASKPSRLSSEARAKDRKSVV